MLVRRKIGRKCGFGLVNDSTHFPVVNNPAHTPPCTVPCRLTNWLHRIYLQAWKTNQNNKTAINKPIFGLHQSKSIKTHQSKSFSFDWCSRGREQLCGGVIKGSRSLVFQVHRGNAYVMKLIWFWGRGGPARTFIVRSERHCSRGHPALGAGLGGKDVHDVVWTEGLGGEIMMKLFLPTLIYFSMDMRPVNSGL